MYKPGGSDPFWPWTPLKPMKLKRRTGPQSDILISLSRL